MKKSPSGKRKRWPWVAGALVLATVLFFTPPGEVLWVGPYPVLVWFHVDRWFPWSADIELMDVSGPDVEVAGSPARRLEVAKVGFLACRFTDIDFGWRILDPGSGPTVRVHVRTWHPLKSRRLAHAIRRAYAEHPADSEARLAVKFATDWPEHTFDGERLPPSVDFPPPVRGVPWEPLFDETARLVLRAGTNAVPHLLEIATRTNPGWYNHLEAHVLLCKILGVRSRGADDEWCGIRASDWFENRRDTPDIRAIWTPFRDTGALPADADGFFTLREGPQP